MASGLFGTSFSIPPGQSVLLQAAVGSAVIGFTTPASIVRPAALPLIGAFVYNTVKTASQYVRPRWCGLLGGLSVAFLLQYVDTALLRKWSFATSGPTKRTPPQQRKGPRRLPQDTFLNRLLFGLKTMFSFRFASSPWEVRNVPKFSSKDADYVPSRWKYVGTRLLVASACYLALDLLSARSPSKGSSPPPIGPTFVPFFRRIGQVTAAELKWRPLSAFMFAFSFYSLCEGFQSTVGAIAVATGLSQPQDWKPAFGPLSEAYSLKNFWGKVWHQALRQQLASTASFLTLDILKLPRASYVARWTTVFTCFFLSGVFHTCAGIASNGGQLPARYGTLQFFCTQATGVIVEEAAEELYARFTGKKLDQEPPSVLRRCVGYAWVVAFMAWSVPVWIYPDAARPAPTGNNSFLPFSLIKVLKSGSV